MYRLFPSPVMDILGIFTMIMIMGSAWSVSQFVRRKEWAGFITGTVTFILSFFLFEIENLSYHLSGFGNAASPELAEIMPSKELFILIFVCVLLTSTAMVHHHMFNWYNVISEKSISFCADSMPVGICYYRENGRILLTNACMKRICYEVTGKALLNAFDFTEKICGDYITLKDDSIWKVEHNIKSFDDETIYEIICTDVSELVENSHKLEEKNKEVSALNKKLKSYQLDIDELIKKKEILKAKMDIHDEMNRLMLMTVSALDSGDDKMLDDAMAAWSHNALLATKEGKRYENEYKNVEELARLLGITVANKECIRMVPDEYMELYCTIARESLINISKHSEASVLNISVEANPESKTDTDTYANEKLKFVFENDSVKTFDQVNTDISNPKDLAGTVRYDVELTGGLKNIRRLVNEKGGDVSVRIYEGRFILEAVLPQR